MIHATQHAPQPPTNQNQVAARRQTGSIQAPTPAAGVIAVAPQARLGRAADAANAAERFKKELQEWVELAPCHDERYREEVAGSILEVYEQGRAQLGLDTMALASLPNLGELSNLEVLHLGYFDHVELLEHSEIAKAFFDELCQLQNLRTLKLGFNYLGKLAENPQMAEALGDALGELSNLRSLYLSNNDIAWWLQSSQSGKTFVDRLGQLNNLQTLDLSSNYLHTLAGHPQAAKVFLDALGNLRNLRDLDLHRNFLGHLAQNQQVADAFFNTLGQLNNLQTLDLTANNLGLSLKKPQMVKAFSDCLGKLSNLQSLNLYGNNLGALEDKLQQPVRLRAALRKHNIESERSAIIEQGQPWTPAMAEKLFEQCSTVTDAMSAYEILAHLHDNCELSLPELQSNLETICLGVTTKLIQTDIKDDENLAKVRNQELAYLLSLVQHGAKIGVLTTTAAHNIGLHIQNNQRINQAFSAIQALQQNQQAMLGGLQAMGNALGQHMQHTAQLQMQYNNCFQQLANNQQQLLSKQNQLAQAHGNMRESLQAEIQILRSNQAQIGDNLHQVGLKMLSAQRIKAIGGAVAAGVALLPWVGAGIVEGGRAIASALGVAKARGFALGLESLKDSLAGMGSASVFQTPPLELQNLTLGETMQAQGIQLPNDALTMQFANIRLGDLADGIQLVSNTLADRQVDAAANRLAAFPGRLHASPSALPAVPAPQVSLAVAVPVNTGQHSSQSSAPPALPVLAQPADSAGLTNVPEGQARQLDAMKAPPPTAKQATAQQSAGALPRTDSTGSLASSNEEDDELAAAIKFFDASNPFSGKRLNKLLRKAIVAEQQKPGSTSLTDHTLPTRNSNSRRATAMDLAVHYGRPRVLEAMDDALDTGNEPDSVKLKSAQKKEFSRALSEATRRQSMYDYEGKRIQPSGEQAGKTDN